MVTRREFCAAAAAGVVAGPAWVFGQAKPSLDDFLTQFADEWVASNPTFATNQRYFTGAKQDQLERMLSPFGLAEANKTIALAKKGLGQLRAFDRATLTEKQQLWADVVDWQLASVIEEEPFLDYSFPLQQMNGFNVNVVERFTVSRPLTRVRDAENYVAALAQVHLRINEAIDESKRLAAKGIVPPTFILDATLHQLRTFAETSPANNPFVTSFAEKIAGIAELPVAKREQLQKEAASIVTTRIYPSWKTAIATLSAQLPKSTSDAGLWRLKGGAEAYQFFLKRFTTTNLTAEEIHDLGLRKVAELEAKMDTPLRQIGRSQGTVNQRVEQLRNDLRYPNPMGDASREQIIKDLNAIIQDAAKRAESLFDLRPKSPVEARPFPKFREANAAANYNVPLADGSRPGVVQYPRRVERMTKFGLRTLAYHEAIPGHHFQLALQVEDASLPRFLQMRVFGGNSAHSEGWGLYAERLAAESGWYEGDVEGQLGQLSDELWRARRLVVDTGLHAKKWTREQAIDYGIEASEIERYVVYPGQACSYMVGQLKYLDLREKARTALGPAFSLREYHNVVLTTGNVPLHVMERVVDSYIARRKA
jgi:uncharacterized protein (DUF885 family)